MPEPPGRDDSIATRESLLRRLKNWDDKASWQDFFDTYWRLIYSVARRAGLSDAEAQDIVQETLISVAKNMPQFHYDPSVGSFKAWLCQLTRWRITDQFRKRQYEKDGQRYQREEPLSTSLLETKAADNGFDLTEAWDDEWRKNLFEVALEKVRRQISPTQFQLFSLHAISGIPARLVADRVGAKLSEVYFAKYKISALIRKEMKGLENKMK